MKIVNIDASENLVKKVQSLMIPRFILDVIKPLEEKYYMLFARHQLEDSFRFKGPTTVSLPTFPIRMFWEFAIGYENIATLIHTIPIYLRTEMPKTIDETGIIETLGAYYPIVPNNPNIKRDSPYIELFLGSISEGAEGDDTWFKWLFTKVLLHELAHAAMDVYNIEGFQNMVEKVTYKTKFGKWREESMANAVALKIIKDSQKADFYEYAKDFISNKQIDEYKLGALLEEGFDHWDFKSVISGKINGVNGDLQDKWYDYVNGKPTAIGLKEWNNILSKRYVYKFNDNYYTEEKELVFAIVNVVLTNYMSAYGRTMDFETFSSIFPYIKTGAEMSYEPLQ